MKAVILFFLPILIIFPISASAADEAGFELSNHDYKLSQVATAEKASAFTFDYEGNYIFAEDISAKATKRRAEIKAFRIVKVLADGTRQNLVERTQQIITHLSFYKGEVYAISRGQIYKIRKGRLSGVLSGLPFYGDFGNSNVVFHEGAMYFGVGTATNSGVVGPDNSWVGTYPSVRDIPCSPIKLSGVNVAAENFLTEKKDDTATTGSFMTYNMPSSPGQTVYGMNKCNGAILKSAPDGSNLQVYADGLHNPKSLSVDDRGNIWVLDGGMEDRGVRPIKDGKDSVYRVSQNTWYGWPDFNAGNQVSASSILSEFRSTPPRPEVVFDLNQVKYFIISPNRFWPNTAILQVADDKLAVLNLTNNQAEDFAKMNGKIVQMKFGPDDKLYVLVSDGKTDKLFTIESTKIQVAAASTGGRNRIAFNWPVYSSLLLFLIGSGTYAVRTMKRTSGSNMA